MGKFDDKGGDDIKRLAVEINGLHNNVNILRDEIAEEHERHSAVICTLQSIISDLDEERKVQHDTHNAIYGALWSIIHDLADKAGLKIDVIAAVEAEWKRDEARGLHWGTYDDPENMPTKDVKGALEDTRGALE